MRVLFLDFDGVMATDYHSIVMERDGLPDRDDFGVIFDPQCVENLSRIIASTGADIVVTSDWQEIMTYQDICRMWEFRHLPGSVIDSVSVISKRRGDNIDAWIESYGPLESYLIIDDLPICEFNNGQLDHLIQVDSYRGLHDSVIDKAISILLCR